MKIPNFTPTREAGRLRCIKRNKSIKSTPEELVRQRILHWLVHRKKADLNDIELESSVRFVAGNRGRADIVFRSSAGSARFLIECKKAGFPLGLEAVRQAQKYANKIGCREVLITDGEVHRCFAKSDREWVEEPRSAFLGEKIPVGRTPCLPVKPNVARLDNFMRKLPGLEGISDRTQLRLMRSLCTLIFSKQNWCPSPKVLDELFLLKDLGVVALTVSTPGGRYYGYYRLFLVATDNRVETMGIALQDYEQNKAQICVGVVKNDRTRHDLQLRIKGNVRLRNDGSIEIRHSGKMPRPFTREKVFEAVREAGRDDMIRLKPSQHISLGVLPPPNSITKAKAEKFVGSLLHYTLLRTALKDTYHQR